MTLKRDRMMYILYIATFFFSVHQATTAYINSTFAGTFIPENSVGILYTISSILGIFGLLCMPECLKRFGNARLAFVTLIIHFIALFGMIMGANGAVIIGSFVLYLITNILTIFFLDIFLEKYTLTRKTGGIRGLYLSITNLAWVFSPFLSGLIISAAGFRGVYIFALFSLIPTALLSALLIGKFKDPIYKHTSIVRGFHRLTKTQDVRRIWVLNFLLQFFYAWMVIYMPIYLHNMLHFSWSDIGIMFTIMLLPFVLLEYPLGRVADKSLGEKELLVLGFIIAGASTLVVAHLNSTSVVFWGIILFLTRVGAAMIEVMSETYFFKKITPDDSDLISMFRNGMPLAYVFAPIVATIFLTVLHLPFAALFITLGATMLVGALYAMRLRDTN
jgi:MFS family permease